MIGKTKISGKIQRMQRIAMLTQQDKSAVTSPFEMH